MTFHKERNDSLALLSSPATLETLITPTSGQQSFPVQGFELSFNLSAPSSEKCLMAISSGRTPVRHCRHHDTGLYAATAPPPPCLRQRNTDGGLTWQWFLLLKSSLIEAVGDARSWSSLAAGRCPISSTGHHPAPAQPHGTGLGNPAADKVALQRFHLSRVNNTRRHLKPRFPEAGAL